jgi:hypothetical protein
MRLAVTRWLLLAGLATALCLLLYLVSQQIWRQLANDPQLQMARDAAAELAGGLPPEAVVPRTPVDMAHSLAPFVMVLSDTGAVLASNGRLDGQPRTIPGGVLDYVRTHTEERVTWQPERGVRIAAVVVRNPLPPTGFVVAGRSLDETQDRIAQFGRLIAVGWLGAITGLLVLVIAVSGPSGWSARSSPPR